MFLIQNKICHEVPPVSFSLSAPGPLISALSPSGVPRAAPGRHGRARSRAIKRRPAAISAVRNRQHRSERRAPLCLKPSPASPLCSSAASPLLVENREPPLLFKLAAVPTGKRRCAGSSPVPPRPPRPPVSLAAPPAELSCAPLPRALCGEPLLPKLPQSSPPPHRVAVAAIPDPPHRWPVTESGQPLPPLPQTPIPSPASAWAACCLRSCGPRPVLCQWATLV
jgi:hypothetical protein